MGRHLGFASVGQDAVPRKTRGGRSSDDDFAASRLTRDRGPVTTTATTPAAMVHGGTVAATYTAEQLALWRSTRTQQLVDCGGRPLLNR